MEKLRTSRVAEQMKKEVGEIVNQKLQDPRIGFVTVTDVSLTNDLQQATIYVSVLGDEKEKNESLAGLQQATGFVRSEVSKRIRLRKVPEITFTFDDAHEHGNRIEEILQELKNE